MAIYHHFVTAPYDLQSNSSAMLFLDNALMGFCEKLFAIVAKNFS